MYKLLLCLRYLRTRYLAVICVVSVMLGVATLIVVNSVMSGFSTKLKDRLHGVLSDIVVETDRFDGFPEPPAMMLERIRQSPAGPKIAAMSPTVEVFAMLQFRFRGEAVCKPVRLIGIDPADRAKVGGFAEYLTRQKHETTPNFELTGEALQRFEWNKRVRDREEKERAANNLPEVPAANPLVRGPDDIPPPEPPPEPPVRLHGAIPGFMLAHFSFKSGGPDGAVETEQVLAPGDDIQLVTVGAQDVKPVWGTFVVADYFKSEMSEYDQSFVFVPLEQLQRIRGMDGRVSSVHIKLKDYAADKDFVVDELQKLFSYRSARVATWEAHQGAILAAIEVERGILNLLLFLIVGVAGFSILAIFTMIVSEKYRDIGILKSLGASSGGVMAIFLGYGLLLGLVGSGLGTVMGLAITENINELEAFLTRQTGTALFPRDVYYFDKIPVNTLPTNVALINLGAVLIAVTFSVLPAMRAAMLNPVRALRYE